MAYFNDIKSGIRTTLKGLSLTFRHIRNATHRRTAEGIADATYFDQQNGLVTLQYPHEQLPIPDNGRYRLRNEIDDCIVCDKCAKVCPVDCITIDAIKATEEVGRASDGSPIRLYAATFDIDMAKCCYCGLCTVVCPTECLTMDKKFDYSEFELGKLTYEFANLTTAEADEKRNLYELFLREKEEQKAAQAAAKAATQPSTAQPANKPKPAFRPTAKPAATPPSPEPANSAGSSMEHPLTDATPDEMQHIAQGGLESMKHPVFRPAKRPAGPTTGIPEEADDEPTKESTAVQESTETAPKPKAASGGFRPTMKPAKSANTDSVEKSDLPESGEPTKPKPVFRPTMKPPKSVTDDLAATSEPQPTSEEPIAEAKARPVFRPTMKPKTAQSGEAPIDPENQPTIDKPVSEAPATPESAVQRPKPAFRPTMKPKATPSAAEPEEGEKTTAAADSNETPVAETPRPKPVFRPTMKPKAPPSTPPSDDDGKSA
jgi:formate hydrogenlyase subunit 6/NADH:ubiquinone oxidoreductase subunit I